MVLAVRGVEAFLWVCVPPEVSGEQTILAACPSFSTPSWKPVNPSPCLQSPVIQIPPLSPNPLIPPLELEFSQDVLSSDVLGFGKQTFATHNLEILC